jgi:hypothetical protein
MIMAPDDEFLWCDADDEKAVKYIRNYLPQELKEKFCDDLLYYFLDLIDEYYIESGVLDAEADEEGFVTIDLEEAAKFVAKAAEDDGCGKFDPEEIFFVVQGEMEYGYSLEQVE